MQTKALRLLIREKLIDGRLPHNGVVRLWGSTGNGQQCLACEGLVTKTEFVMEGQLVRDGDLPADVSFHVLCFHMWDDERHRVRTEMSWTNPDRESGVALYKSCKIVTAATNERVGAWSVAVVVLDSKDAVIMEPCDLGGGVTFETKAVANQAGLLFARAWIDGRS